LLAIHAPLSRSASVLRGEFHLRQSESETAGGKSRYSICLLIQFPTRLPLRPRGSRTTIRSVPVTRSRAGRNRKRSTAELSKDIPCRPHLVTSSETSKSSRPCGQVNAPRRPGFKKSVPRTGGCQPPRVPSIRIASPEGSEPAPRPPPALRPDRWISRLDPLKNPRRSPPGRFSDGA
jgi:hypothetical protein